MPTKKSPKKALQRRWKIDQEYTLESVTGTRRVTLVGRGKIGDREVLLLHPVRAAKKTKR
jgi:hypothetical protein